METSGLIAGINRLIAGATPSASAPPAALAAISAFRASTATSPWNLLRTSVANRLEELVLDPTKVNQGALGLCGPAAFLRCWISEDPKGFVDFAATLYDTGKAKLGTMDIEPDSDLVGQDYVKNVSKPITAKHGASLIPPTADWMVMCSLIDDANDFADYEGTEDEDWSDGSDPDRMVDWFEAVGHTVDDSQTDLVPIVPLPKSRHVVLVVNSALLGSSSSGVLDSLRRTLNVPDHFIVLETQLSKTVTGTNNFVAWTWGKTTNYHPTDDQIDDWVDEIIVAD